MTKYLLLGLLWLLHLSPTLAQKPERRLPRHARPARKALLDAAVLETSGLQYTDGGLWTFNDSGNEPVLFRVDTASGRVVQRVRISNYANIDWEELAADAQYFYIGDFGNNYGNRRDLRILRVPKAGIDPTATNSVSAEEIAFRYPDQTDFSDQLYRNNADCEAFFYHNDSLHLFTKSWLDFRTRYYTVPARPGSHVAHFKGAFATKGVITGATLNAAGTAAVLLGYRRSTGTTFLWLLTDYQGTHFLAGNKRRIKLPNAFRLGQAEGIAFVNGARVFISNERLPKHLTLVRQRLWALHLGRWLSR